MSSRPDAQERKANLADMSSASRLGHVQASNQSEDAILRSTATALQRLYSIASV